MVFLSHLLQQYIAIRHIYLFISNYHNAAMPCGNAPARSTDPPNQETDMKQNNIAIVYHSGYGHTKKQAEAVRDGAATIAGIRAELVPIDAEGNLTEATWAALNEADAIVFGSPTYMGNVSWQFKKFADASSKAWGARAWQDKIAAGFTNSATINGDKHATLQAIQTLALQHGMLWVGTGMTASNKKSAGRNDLNWLGSFSGLMAQSPSDSSPEEGPLPGDLETARQFGARVAETAQRWNGRVVPAQKVENDSRAAARV